MNKPTYVNLDKLTANFTVLVDNGNYLVTTDDIRMALYMAAAETGDVVEVVRCKDCQFAKFNTSADVYKCGRRGYFMETVAECDFCSKGKRKEQT